MSDLEQILNGAQPEPETPAVEQAPEPQVEEANAEDPVAAPVASEPEVKPEPEPSVPVSVVQELRRELRELKAERQRAEVKPAPDVFDDPQGYQNFMQEAVRASATGTKLEMSRFMAEREFGADVVQAAYDYFDEHPHESVELLKHPSPFHAAVEIFNRQRVASEIGSDPDKWMAAKEAEIRAKLEAEMVAKQARALAGTPAPSMANVTGTGGGPKGNWTGPTPLNRVLRD